MQHLLASLAIAAPVAMGIVATPSPPPAHEVFTFDDARITESSALVVDKGRFVTINDSGHTGDVFVVDRRGHTVGVTHWSDDPVDTEALAPGGPGAVWVADIGDNTGSRSSVEITRVPIGRGDRTAHVPTYELTYPDGPTDAETMLWDPRTGRLYIASKNVFGGVLYAVPQHLEPGVPGRLKAVGRVLPVATDGAFFPDGEHLIVRNYTTAVVYDWPSLRPIGSVRLPSLRQGEGIAVAADGEVYLSSEGPRAPVLELELPPKIRAMVTGQETSAPSSSASPAPSDTSPAGEQDPASRDTWPWLAGGLLGVAALVVLLRALRPH
jgi:hypothetical protein